MRLLVLCIGLSLGWSCFSQAPTEEGSELLIVQGIFAPEGQKLVSCSPLQRFKLDREVSPLPQPASGTFQLIVHYADNTADRYFFDALVADDAGNTYHGFFELIIPIRQPTIKRLEITDAAGDKVFKIFSGSEIPE